MSKFFDSRLWSFVIFVLLVSVGVALALFVNRTTTDIRDALAAEVLQQQGDVALLLHEYDALRLAFETERLSRPVNADSVNIKNALSNIEDQLEVMRFNYSFERLDGAATAHAYVRPILEDVRNWIADGIPGVERNSEQIVSVASKRILERYEALRAIASETNEVANELINVQTTYLTRFGKSLIFLLAAFALLAIGITALLIRQRDLQYRITVDQQQHAERIQDFADTGADWFWEMNPGMRLRVLSGRSLLLPTAQITENLPSANDDALPAFDQDIIDDHWPIDLLFQQVGFSDHESEWVSENGLVNTISVSGKPVYNERGVFAGYRGVGRDITVRKQIEVDLETANLSLIEAETRGRQQAEQALRDSEMFLRTSLNALPQNLAIIDDNGIVLEANTAWHINSLAANNTSDDSAVHTNMQEADFDGQLYGGDEYVADHQFDDEHNGLGVHYKDVLTRQLVEDIALRDTVAKIDWVLDGHAESLRTEVQVNVSGNNTWYAVALSPFESNGKRYGVLATENVTDRILLEEQDRQFRAELAHFSRLTTVGELATGLAHELNQPLTAISHNCDALLSGIDTLAFDKDDLDAINEIHSEAERAGAIIKGLRKLVRKETAAVVPTDINQLVTETMRLSMPDAKKAGITIQLDLAEDLPDPEIDAVQIQQVLVNLERNGMEAIRVGGVSHRKMVISTRDDRNGLVRVTVQDSGGGFSDSVRENLFSPFLTTKKDGMGMGLSISRSIIESHGGQLWVDFEDPGMTTFHFTLPVASYGHTPETQTHRGNPGI